MEYIDKPGLARSVLQLTFLTLVLPICASPLSNALTGIFQCIHTFATVLQVVTYLQYVSVMYIFNLNKQLRYLGVPLVSSVSCSQSASRTEAEYNISKLYI